jgi:hypothetical protein
LQGVLNKNSYDLLKNRKNYIILLVIKVKILSDKITIYKLTKECEETLTIMKDLGFEDIIKPGMLHTAGRIMTLKKGCEFRKIDYNLAKEAFLKVGIKFEEE